MFHLASSRAVFAVSLSVLAAVVLAGCGSSSDSTVQDSSASTSASASASATSSASALGADIEAPAGAQILVAPQNRVAVPVPEGWGSYNRDMSLDDEAGKETLGELAQALRGTEQEARAMVEGVDAVSISLDVDENDVAGAVTLADDPVEADALPSEDEMRQVIEGDDGGTLKGYEVVDTAHGQIVVARSSLDMKGKMIHGALLVLPSGAEGKFADVAVTAGSDEAAEELIQQVVASWQPVS